MVSSPQGNFYDQLADNELVAMTRDGEPHAFAALWRRHAGTAYSVARTFDFQDPDDLVSASFLKFLEILRKGGGPDSNVRPYLMMIVRNQGRSQYTRARETLDIEIADKSGLLAGDADDDAMRELEHGNIVAAFKTLPERWQEVLWYSEVDGIQVKEIATYVGLAPNATSALIRRARLGLRDAWINSQLATARTPECAQTIRHLGAYTRDSLAPRTRATVDKHLATCPTCPDALHEAQSLARLTLVLLPVTVGLTGAAAYSALTPSPSMPMALSNSAGASSATPMQSEDETKEPTHRWVPLIVAAVAVLLIPLVASPALHLPELDPLTIEASTPDVTQDLNGPLPRPTPTMSSQSVEVETPERAPVPAPGAPAQPRDAAPPAWTQTPAAAADVPRPVAAPAVPALGDLSAPTVTLTQPNSRFFPRATGQGAVPGATIQLLNPDDEEIGTTTVRGDGSWQARIVEGMPGTQSFTARQRLGKQLSPASEQLQFTVEPPPDIASPAADSVVSASRFGFQFTTTAGTVIQREIVGATPLQTLRPPGGSWNETLTLPAGQYTLRVRYVDTSSGDFGPFAETRFIAE